MYNYKELFYRNYFYTQMETMSLSTPTAWLMRAKSFNTLWHECLDFLHNDPPPNLSDIEQKFYYHQSQMFLEQKLNCQLTALTLVYEANNQSEPIVLSIDENEKGIAGDGVFYSLYPKGQFHLACHIPKDELLKNLTQAQCEFFGLI